MCTPPMIQRYVSKVSGPLLDRIDIHIEVPAVQYKELRGRASAEGSAEIRTRVLAARERQHIRFAVPLNGQPEPGAPHLGVPGELARRGEHLASEMWDRKATRAQSKPIFSNSQMNTQQIRTFCDLSADAERLLERAMQQQGLTARAHDRILKVSRTIADLDGVPDIAVKHIAEAIQYRTLDRSYWA